MIPGKAGVGKSKTIQTITENFVVQGMGNTLDKGMYTGLATSIIDGKMLHPIAMMPLRGGKQSLQMMKVLDEYWKDNHYLIINEISMVSGEMFAKLSSIISCAKAGEVLASEEPFGGLNVILVGNFHQFPTMATKPSAPLYCPCNPEKDMHNDLLGRKLYKQFNTIVCLKTQVRVTHPEWLELLQHVRHGNCDGRTHCHASSVHCNAR